MNKEMITLPVERIEKIIMDIEGVARRMRLRAELYDMFAEDFRKELKKAK